MAHALTTPLEADCPFQARMAPDMALVQTRVLPIGAVVLDAMNDSGTAVCYSEDLGPNFYVDSDLL